LKELFFSEDEDEDEQLAMHKEVTKQKALIKSQSVLKARQTVKASIKEQRINSCELRRIENSEKP